MRFLASFALITLIICPLFAGDALPTRKPNVVFILADDK